VAKRSYYNAAYPEPWQVLGVRLKPFSLGHYLKLSKFNCAFVAETERVATLGDLILGVAVCSMSSHPDPERDEFWQWWNRPARFNLLAWALGKTSLTPAEKEVVKWGRKVGVQKWEDKAKLFAQYIEEHSSAPGYWITGDGVKTKQSGGHWSHCVLHGLVSECGYTLLDAYNVPVSRALHDFLKAAEAQGTVKLMTEEQLLLAERMEAKNGAT
jgi:hypothetical protein